jgi:hypothetical protein
MYIGSTYSSAGENLRHRATFIFVFVDSENEQGKANALLDSMTASHQDAAGYIAFRSKHS